MTDVMDGNLHREEDLLAAGHTMADLRAAEKAELVIEFMDRTWISRESWLAIGNGLDQAVPCLRHPGAIVCFYSAALWHLLSDEDPSQIWTSALEVPGIVWTGLDRTVGVETYEIAGVTVRITNAARTTVDLLRYREELGEEPARAALMDWRERGSDADLLDIARALGCELRIADDLAHVPPRGMCWRY